MQFSDEKLSQKKLIRNHRELNRWGSSPVESTISRLKRGTHRRRESEEKSKSPMIPPIWGHCLQIWDFLVFRLSLVLRWPDTLCFSPTPTPVAKYTWLWVLPLRSSFYQLSCKHSDGSSCLRAFMLVTVYIEFKKYIHWEVDLATTNKNKKEKQCILEQIYQT